MHTLQSSAVGVRCYEVHEKRMVAQQLKMHTLDAAGKGSHTEWFVGALVS